MLGPFHHSPRAATAITVGLFALTALVAISSSNPQREGADTVCDGATATCSGRTWEKLICDDPIKVTKCIDAKTTCASWNVCDCCSPVPLHKCLSPLAGRAFDADCVSPIDAREQCCGDATTHRRAFQALADLQEDAIGAYNTGVEVAETAYSTGKEAAETAYSAGVEAANTAYTAGVEAANTAVEAGVEAASTAVSAAKDVYSSATE